MLGRPRCAQTQHEMRIIRCRGVGLRNEVEAEQKQVEKFAVGNELCQPW